jgi:uncharacterized damage-inducible protein DinB
MAGELDNALNGGAWHGPSWREVLDGLTRREALTRPISGAHSIAEIVLHATTWHDVVRRRLQGETPEVSDAQDWPAGHPAGEEAWRASVDRLLETGRSLCETVRGFPAARLQESRPNGDGTWFELIIGEVQHDLYHAGQVGILRKAAERT